MVAAGASVLAPGVVYTLKHRCLANASVGEAAMLIDVNIPPRGGQSRILVFTQLRSEPQTFQLQHSKEMF